MSIRKAFEWLKSHGFVEKYNPYHMPAGTPEGGQFATSAHASGAGKDSVIHVPYKGTRIEQAIKKFHIQDHMKEIADTGRRVYRLTDQDLKKFPHKLDREDWMERRTPSAKKPEASASGKQKTKYALQRMQAAIEATASGPEYARGLGQGRLDRFGGHSYLTNDVPKDEKNKSFNIGYHRGYTESHTDFAHTSRNPNYEDHIKERSPNQFKYVKYP